MLTLSPATPTLNACLGNYEQYFVKSSGYQVCIVDNSWLRILCWFSYTIQTLIASNLLDAILLYVCFNKVKHQTEKSRKMIGKKAYEVRKRYVKNQISVQLPKMSTFKGWAKSFSFLCFFLINNIVAARKVEVGRWRISQFTQWNNNKGGGGSQKFLLLIWLGPKIF